MDSTINNCYFYGCNSIDSNAVFCEQGNMFTFTKSNFLNANCNKYTISMEDETNTLNYTSLTRSKLSSNVISDSILQGNKKFTVKNLNISNSAAKRSQLLYEDFESFSTSFFLVNNCLSHNFLTLGTNRRTNPISLFKYISITNSKSKYCFICNSSYTNFENIYVKNLTCQNNIYFYTDHTIEINNCYSDQQFEISGENKIKNVFNNYSDTIPISGYYEGAILDFLSNNPYKSSKKTVSKSIIIKQMKAEFKLDKVIFQNITSSEFNGTGGAISICCFSSSIDITNCKFEICQSMSLTKRICGGAIHIIGYNTYTNICNVYASDCLAGRGHFCDIYSNYFTNLSKVTISKCCPSIVYADAMTNYIYFDNCYKSSNFSKNYMRQNMIWSYQKSEFTNCVIESNTLIHGTSYVKSSSLSLTSCFIYNNNMSFSTFEYDEIELYNCYLLIESNYNFSNHVVNNCSINNITYDFINNLAISEQIGCEINLIKYSTFFSFEWWKIIAVVISVLLVVAIVAISLIVLQNRKYKRLEDRINLENIVISDFG